MILYVLLLFIHKKIKETEILPTCHYYKERHHTPVYFPLLTVLTFLLVKTTRVLEGLLPDEEQAQSHHRRDPDSEAEEIQVGSWIVIFYTDLCRCLSVVRCPGLGSQCIGEIFLHD